MNRTIRTFIAVELPEDVLSWIGSIQAGLRKSGLGFRWVPVKNIHLTLKFLGDVQEGDIQKIGQEMLETARRFAPVSMTAKGIGVFPDFRRPRVVWVGVSGRTGGLVPLQSALEDRLADIGYPKERRPFKQHLTLGRAKKRIDTESLVQAVTAFSGQESEPFLIEKITLFKSDLKPSGAVYSNLLEAPLEVK